jgi:hypothetical protein
MHITFLLSSLSIGFIMPKSLMEIHINGATSLVGHLSIHTLSAAYFCRMHRQQEIMDRGTLIYSQALRHLNKDLRDGKNAYSLSVLSSAITLEAYEVS